MMSWHLRSVTFAAEILAWMISLGKHSSRKVYAPSTEQPLVSENCDFLTERQRPRKSKDTTKAGSLLTIVAYCERLRMFDRRSSPSTRLDFACVERSIVCNDYTISRILHHNKNISPWMAATKISNKIGEFNKMLKGSSTLGRHQEISL